MIINHKNIEIINLAIKTERKYSNDYSFVPLKIYYDNEYRDCIFQTPSLFIPFGIQQLNNDKKILDLSFHNKENDKNVIYFEEKLLTIFKIIEKEYKNYNVNQFLKKSEYDNCMRLKIYSHTRFYDQFKNLSIAKPFTYGKFIIQLDGLWISKKKDIWFQWSLLQAKIYQEIKLTNYSILEDEEEPKNDKYNKMLRMGVPAGAIQLKMNLDKGIPPPPPLPPPSKFASNKKSLSKIKAKDLQNVILKKTKAVNKIKIKNPFDPPSLEELQFTISKLKKI